MEIEKRMYTVALSDTGGRRPTDLGDELGDCSPHTSRASEWALWQLYRALDTTTPCCPPHEISDFLSGNLSPFTGILPLSVLAELFLLTKFKIIDL